MSFTIGTSSYTEFSDSENSRTWTLDDHTVAKPQLVIQKRIIPSSMTDSRAYATSILKVIQGTVDGNGDPMQQKVSFDLTIRYPQGAAAADVTEARALFQEVVASTEFTALVNGQQYLG